MPFRDGTGPLGQGPGAGKGMGRGGGRGRKRRGRPGSGPGVNCVCPGCGTKIPHRAGAPCGFLNCPKCGNRMVRE